MQTQKASRFWYLLPIFLGVIGGVVSFVVLRKEDNLKAKNCLILGILISAVSVIVYFSMLLAAMAR